jgi:D-alanyl-D-alanine carboxypeptidase
MTKFVMGLSLVALVLTLCSVLVAAEPAQVPSGPAGQRVTDYFTAFNSGNDQAMLSYFDSNLTATALARRTNEQRLDMYHEMLGRMKSLELYKVLSASDSVVSVLARGKGDNWLSFTFLLEPAPARRVAGLRVEITEPPAENEPSTPLTLAQAVTEIEKYLDSLVAADQFSGTVLLAKNGATYFAKAYGLASKEYEFPNRTDTKFNLGSINKVFTQIAICRLADQGKLSFDDLLGKWLPDYPNKQAREKVTIRQLLTMSSGIGDFFGEKFDATPKDRLRTISDYLPLFAEQPLLFEPGSKEQYSNGGYVVLGAIIEKVTGRTYYDYVRENIFAPAGMTSTDSYEADIPTPNLAEGYTTVRSGADVPEGSRVSNFYTRPARGSSAGGGYSTAEDLLKFVGALQEHKLLSPAATRRVLDRNYGAGPSAVSADSARENSGGMAVAGGAPGISAMLEFDFGTGSNTVVLSNYDPPTAVQVGRRIRGTLARVK